MTCAEFQEQVAALALGALEPEEQAACEAHLAGPGPHQGCEKALAEARETTARLSLALPRVAPGPEVWKRIEARLVGTGTAAAGAARPRPALREAVAWGMAAAAAVMLFFMNGRLGELRKETAEREQLQTQVRSEALARAQAAQVDLAHCRTEAEALRTAGALQREVVAMLDQPGTRMVALKPQPGQTAQASAVVNLRLGRALLVSSALAPRPDKDYELWIIRGKAAPIPAGLVRYSQDGVTLAEFDRQVLAPGANAFAVSLEPRGGSATPTEVLMVGTLAG